MLAYLSFSLSFLFFLFFNLLVREPQSVARMRYFNEPVVFNRIPMGTLKTHTCNFADDTTLSVCGIN